jgi:membrane-bound serine protease (ClpP class)
VTAILIVVGLIVAGLGLLAIEILVIPGFGLIGVLGGVAIVSSGWVAYAEISAGYSLLAVLGGFAASGLMFWLLPKTHLGKSMVLETAHRGIAANPSLQLLLGREGVALTKLRPSGTVEIDDHPVDVVTDGEFVELGTRVRVQRVEGARVVVAPTRADA